MVGNCCFGYIASVNNFIVITMCLAAFLTLSVLKFASLLHEKNFLLQDKKFTIK